MVLFDTRVDLDRVKPAIQLVRDDEDRIVQIIETFTSIRFTHTFTWASTTEDLITNVDRTVTEL